MPLRREAEGEVGTGVAVGIKKWTRWDFAFTRFKLT